jgi:hypothetical protein
VLGNTGIWTNVNSIVLRWGNATGNTSTIAADQAVFLGTIRTTADGQTEDSTVRRYLSNAWNDAERPMARQEAATSWNYSSGTLQQANTNAANQLDYICCLARAAWASVGVVCASSGSTIRYVNAQIGVDSSVAGSAQIALLASCTVTQYTAVHAYYAGTPGLGRHTLRWLECGGGTDTQTWWGGQITVAGQFGGMVGSVRG